MFNKCMTLNRNVCTNITEFTNLRIPMISVLSLMNVMSTLITYNYHCIFVNLLFRSTTLLLFLLHPYSCCFLIKFQSISQDCVWLKPNKTSIKKKSRIKVIPYNSSCQQYIFLSQQITLRFAIPCNFWRIWKPQKKGRLLFFKGKHWCCR